MGNKGQIGHPSEVTDEEWVFVAPYLALCREDSEQREHNLRAVFNGLRYIVHTGGQWHSMNLTNTSTMRHISGSASASRLVRWSNCARLLRSLATSG
jgi:hypothetical protein